MAPAQLGPAKDGGAHPPQQHSCLSFAACTCPQPQFPTCARLPPSPPTPCSSHRQARVQNETNDAKNALEAYIYSLRNKLYDALSPFIREEAKTQLLEKLETLENWLYEEGEDETKSVYVAKLGEVKALGGPVEGRAANAATLPAAADSLRRTCQGFLAALNEPRTAHLEEADKQTVAGECQNALDWLSEKEGLQQQTAKYDDPVLLAADVEKKEGTVRRVCEPILSKKPPPPPKKEEPAPQAAEEAGGEEMETEAGPPPPPAAEGDEEPMEA
jgi:heat shock protein 4